MKNRSTGRLGGLFLSAVTLKSRSPGAVVASRVVTLESRSPGAVVINKESGRDPGTLRAARHSGMTPCDERRSGFTLMELLVVILIIGILTAVALPKYQSAVDKSRYSTLMPTAKTIANSQETFYMANGGYSEDLSHLDAHLVKDASGATARLSDGTLLELSQRESHKYVKMSKDGLDNNYIVYQAHSPNYAQEIHCEALKDSARAERLCTSLGGEKINGYLTPGYETYVLEGTGFGMSADVVDKIEQGGNGGWQACDTYPCTKPCNRPVASGYTCNGTYQEDGSYTERSCQGEVCVEKHFGKDGKMDTKRTCVLNGNICHTKTDRIYDENGNQVSFRDCYRTGEDGQCNSYNSRYEYTYDENGNTTLKRYCLSQNIDASGNCLSYSKTGGSDYAYDEKGNLISTRNCTSFGADGSCSSWRDGNEYTYDEKGNKTSDRYCTKYAADGTCMNYLDGHDYIYDENGKVTMRSCRSISSDGTCNSPYGVEYIYDENGNITGARNCNRYGASGVCENYSSTFHTDYTYDENGNRTSERACRGLNADGSCFSYTSGWDYAYDENGNQISKRECRSIAADGSCNYSSGWDSGYDENGNKTSERYCRGISADGNCTGYSGGVEYTYDANGNQTSNRRCSTYSDDGSCSAYSKGTEWTYDDKGNKISEGNCSSYGSDGKCTAYSSIRSYDEKGNETSFRLCKTFGSDGSCTEYSSGYDYIYDEDGNRISSKSCNHWNGTVCDWAYSTYQ